MDDRIKRHKTDLAQHSKVVNSARPKTIGRTLKSTSQLMSDLKEKKRKPVRPRRLSFGTRDPDQLPGQAPSHPGPPPLPTLTPLKLTEDINRPWVLHPTSPGRLLWDLFQVRVLTFETTVHPPLTVLTRSRPPPRSLYFCCTSLRCCRCTLHSAGSPRVRAGVRVTGDALKSVFRAFPLPRRSLRIRHSGRLCFHY